MLRIRLVLYVHEQGLSEEVGEVDRPLLVPFPEDGAVSLAEIAIGH